MDTMHLFAGAGGGLLADRILGHTPLVAVEWEPYPAQVLRERRDEGWFPGLRVWEGDVRMFDPSEYTGRVDCIHAGFPCQDISQAGKQAGVGEGTRSGLYREVLRIAGIVGPRLIFLENVAAIKSNGLETVLKDLACMGYDTRWMCIRASDVGAPHHRDRWFALAYTGRKRMEKQTLFRTSISSGSGQIREGQTLESVQEDIPHSDSIGLQGTKRGSRTREERQPDGHITEYGKAPWWETEPRVGRVVDGMAHRSHQLKAIGNGQVPLQVAVAFTILAKGLI